MGNKNQSPEKYEALNSDTPIRLTDEQLLKTSDEALDDDQLKRKRQLKRQKAGMCIAENCPLPGGIHVGDGWACRYHYSHPNREEWGKITNRLKRSDVADRVRLHDKKGTRSSADDDERFEKLDNWIRTGRNEKRTLPDDMRKAAGLRGKHQQDAKKPAEQRQPVSAGEYADAVLADLN